MSLLSNLFGKKDQSCCDMTIEEVNKDADVCCENKPKSDNPSEKEKGNSCCE